jgi:hypothetical protein
MKWNEPQIKDAQRVIKNGGVAINPDWLARRADNLGSIQNLITELGTIPTLFAVYDVRRALTASIERQIRDVQSALMSACEVPPVRDVIGEHAVPEAPQATPPAEAPTIEAVPKRTDTLE